MINWSFKSSNSTPLTIIIESLHLAILFPSTLPIIKAFSRGLCIMSLKSKHSAHGYCSYFLLSYLTELTVLPSGFTEKEARIKKFPPQPFKTNKISHVSYYHFKCRNVIINVNAKILFKCYQKINRRFV